MGPLNLDAITVEGQEPETVGSYVGLNVHRGISCLFHRSLATSIFSVENQLTLNYLPTA